MPTTSKRQRSEETVSNSVETPVAYTHRQILAVLSGLMLGMFLAALDQTIVATAIRTIADDLDGYSLQAWATTAYLVTATLATPLYGKLSDIYGRKPFFMFAITVFVIGSVLCTFSTSMYMLAAFRAVQGLGAGGLFSLALTIIGDIVSPRERAKYQGYFLAVFGTSSVLGPVLGGVFAGQDELLGIDGWRWVFLVNVPVGLVALTVVSRVLHLPRRPSGSRRIDWWGAIALAVGAYLLHTLAADTPMPVVMVFMLILGLGLGNLMQPLTLAIQNALPPQDMGVSTGAATFFRQIGGTAGVAIFLSILFSRLTPAIGERVTAAAGTSDFRRAVVAAAQSNDPAEAAMGQGMLSPDHAGVSGVLTDSSVIGKLDDVLALPFREGFADAIGSVFLSVSMLAVVAFVLTVLWKEVPLRSESGLQAAARGEAEE
ncbi:MDR family MFS transporter [Rhodococcus opacus]|uniref:MDR family MFS transporter n=1 Tax=Rhodococcus opacus TaxID=37919 RepID=UPI0022366E8B|nr:MDR family MFS transporter [Rhodococcus opacus]UZG56434.1 MFS transporter [Rhodococcus opacus]